MKIRFSSRSSQWSVDTEKQTFRRTPHIPGEIHFRLEYTDTDERYETVTFTDNVAFFVTGPEQWEWVRSGTILSVQAGTADGLTAPLGQQPGEA